MILKRLKLTFFFFILALPIRADAEASPVWIDTDISAGIPYHDVDDGYAMLHAIRRFPERIKGIGLSFGNTDDLEREKSILLTLLKDEDQERIPIYLGARNPRDFYTPAARALADALKELPPSERMTILALGRATNIRAALEIYPEGAKKIREFIFNAGRRYESEARVGRFKLRLPDSNYWGDESSFRRLILLGVPVTLVPADLARYAIITPNTLKSWRGHSAGLDRMVNWTKGWMRTWRIGLGEKGFWPFDLMVTAAVSERDEMICDENIPLRFLTYRRRDLLHWGWKKKTRPVVSYSFGESFPKVTYCDRATDRFRGRVIDAIRILSRKSQAVYSVISVSSVRNRESRRTPDFP